MLRRLLAPLPRGAAASFSAASLEAWSSPLWRVVSPFLMNARNSTSGQATSPYVGAGSGGRSGNPALRPPPEVPFDVKGLKHIAVAVPDLAAAAEHYRTAFGAQVSDPQDLPDHGVTSVFVRLPNVNIELLHPLGDRSPISKFLERNPRGGVHHICLAVDNLNNAVDHLSGLGISSLGDGRPTIGAEGEPVLFLHPKDNFGVLTELQQANRGVKEEAVQVAYV